DGISDLSCVRKSRSHATLQGSEKDCFGYEFARLSEADSNSMMRRKMMSSSSASSGGGLQSLMQPAACRSTGGCTCGAAAASNGVAVEKTTEKPHRTSSVRRTLSKAFRAIGEPCFIITLSPSYLSSSCASASACVSPPAVVSADSNGREMERGRESPFELQQRTKNSSCSPRPIKAAKMVHPHSRSASTLLNPFAGDHSGNAHATPIHNRSSSGISSISSRTPPPFPQGAKIRRSFRVEVTSPMSRSLHSSTTASHSPLYADVFSSKHAFYRNHSLDEEEEGENILEGTNGSVAALMRDFEFDDVKSVVSTASTSRLGLEGGSRGSGTRRHYRVKTTNDMRNFLKSPVRLRRRDKAAAQQEAIEAGFEPAPNVARCHSLHSLAYTKSQFTPSIDLNESLRSVGIDYTPSGGGHSYKRDSYLSAPIPPPHRLLDSQSTMSHSPSKPIPIDGVIGSAGYHRSRVHLRDSASASPQSSTYRRSLQQLNNSAVYANLSGSFHEFPLTTSSGGEARRPPIPQRSSLVSDSTVSSASPVVMRQQTNQYSATPLGYYIHL
ncbi:hypothetical protein PMAYCL1PPCAC_29657, partial [Pristionchus mayeri]